MKSKRYHSNEKLNIRRTGIATFGKQFGDEFAKVLVSGFRTTQTPVVKFNKRKVLHPKKSGRVDKRKSRKFVEKWYQEEEAAVSKTAKRWNSKSRMIKMKILSELGLKYQNAKALIGRDYDDLPPRLRSSLSAKLRRKK